MIADADVNSDGLLSFQELLRIIQHQKTRALGQMTTKMFSALGRH